MLCWRLSLLQLHLHLQVVGHHITTFHLHEWWMTHDQDAGWGAVRWGGGYKFLVTSTSTPTWGMILIFRFRYTTYCKIIDPLVWKVWEDCNPQATPLPVQENAYQIVDILKHVQRRSSWFGFGIASDLAELWDFFTTIIKSECTAEHA